MTFVAIGVGGTVPQANAGTDIIGSINQEVTLNGGLSIASAGSFDFLWKQIEGMPVPLRRALLSGTGIPSICFHKKSKEPADAIDSPPFKVTSWFMLPIISVPAFA